MNYKVIDKDSYYRKGKVEEIKNKDELLKKL